MKFKILLFSFFSIFVFLSVIIFFGYKVYTLQKENFELQKKIVFYETYEKSKKFFNAIVKEYNHIKPKIIQNHKYVLHHMDEDIFKIKQKFGKNWHIYKTDENFVIRDTTFKYDKNFSLAFAKKGIIKHTKTIGISSIICESATADFFVFSDSYQNQKALQIGYIISNPEIEKFRNALKEIKKQNKWIKSIILYMISPKRSFKYQKCDFLNPTYSKKNAYNHKDEKIGWIYYHKLIKQNPIFNKNEMYILSSSNLNKNTYIVYRIEINNDYYIEQLDKLKVIISIIILFTILLLSIIMYYLNKTISIISSFSKAIKKEETFEYKKDDEIKLIVDSYNNTLEKLKHLIESKEEFLHFALHELKTPLNVISLYADEKNYLLTSSIKMLSNSYNDMIYFSQLDKSYSNPIKFNLKSLLLERIKFFTDIAHINEKELIYDLNDCFIKADKIDIERLIDNNIKNAIKYSSSKNIYINLSNCILSFENDGEIKNKTKIFDKFYRENKVQGGFGIGLSIIKNICDKYNIKIDIQNKNKVIFKYNFKEIDENSDS